MSKSPRSPARSPPERRVHLPAGIPIPPVWVLPIILDVSDPLLRNEDAFSFRAPSLSFDGWQICISDDRHQVLRKPVWYDIRYENTMGAENPNLDSYTIVSFSLWSTPMGDHFLS